MKALSLTQPWASLVAWGEKHIETRGWHTAFRGPIAIHASKGFPGWAREVCHESPFREVLAKNLNQGVGPWLDLPVGVILATAELEACVRIDSDFPNSIIRLTGLAWTPQEYAFGDYSPGRYAWGFRNVKILTSPRPAKGALGLWEWKP